MERIKLTKREKNVLRLLRDGNSEALSEFDAPSVTRLATIGLVKRENADGDSGDSPNVGYVQLVDADNGSDCERFDDARLTNMGKEYFNDNPRLANPINLDRIIQAVIAVGTLVAAVAALFACAKLI